jgi:hypothetical protein
MITNKRKRGSCDKARDVGFTNTTCYRKQTCIHHKCNNNKHGTVPTCPSRVGGFCLSVNTHQNPPTYEGQPRLKTPPLYRSTLGSTLGSTLEKNMELLILRKLRSTAAWIRHDNSISGGKDVKDQVRAGWWHLALRNIGICPTGWWEEAGSAAATACIVGIWRVTKEDLLKRVTAIRKTLRNDSEAGGGLLNKIDEVAPRCCERDVAPER